MSKEARRAKLLELKQARDGGKREYTAADDTAIYDEVEDSDYQAVVRGRLQEEDFVEDDGIGGYVDNGMDDWDDPARQTEDQDEQDASTRTQSKAAASKASKSIKKRPVAVPRPVNLTANPYIKHVPAGDERDFMDSLLDDLDDKTTIRPVASYATPASLPQKRKATVGSAKITPAALVDPEEPIATDDATKKPRLAVKDNIVIDSMEIDDLVVAKVEDDDDFFQPMSAAQVKSKPAGGAIARRQVVNLVSIKASEPKPEPVADQSEQKPPLPAAPSILPAKSRGIDWKSATASLAVAALPKEEADRIALEDEEDPLPAPANYRTGKKPKVTVPQVKCTEENGTSVKFWWYEATALNGIVYLTGKVQQKDGDRKWVSGMVSVSGVRRKIYLLPREKMLDDEGVPLEDAPEADDVIADFEHVVESRYNMDVGQFKYTPDFVKKKYVFGITSIPRGESDWVEATYPFSEPEIEPSCTGANFSHVMGTNTSLFERFSVDRKIMGPCWLDLQNVTLSDKGLSFCQFEADISVSDVHTFDQNDPAAPTAAPPLTILSLSLRTVLHNTKNTSEIVCASARVWQDCNLEDPRPLQEQPSSVSTLVRPLFGPYPHGFAELAKKTKPAGARVSSIFALADETALLDQLLNIFVRHDPDVIVGADFMNSDLEILLTRMKTLKCTQWERLSHFSRNGRWPSISGRNKERLVGGRLTCDLAGTRELIDSVTWSMNEMCESYLAIEREEIDVDDYAGLFDDVRSTAAKLLHFVQHCEADAYFQMAILHKVQALLLTRQLTNLAGNCWNKTLDGSNRAERNESILVHRFTERGYICPDKFSKKQQEEQKRVKETAVKQSKKRARAKAKAAGEVVEDEEETTGIVASKVQFKGGHVFEPVRGLYDTFILVMDFNSLYPSIIQEYDIDFSTIDWTADNAADIASMPEVKPVAGEPVGILPQLIFFLVDRRRNVKRMMKDASITPAKYLQYNITQQALKLTANSMYGCLGFETGRFCARPLAALTTHKGREILIQTKADAENASLKVIYGDTDSVMIDTNVTDYAAAIKIGVEFKKLVNAKYKKLEIDIDAVFARMLLQSKKKYAAVKASPDGSNVIEVKGLDQKRREYCALAKTALKFVLDRILSGERAEIVIEEIHEYLSSFAQTMRAGTVPLEEFIIYTRMGKELKDYTVKTSPFIAVALRMKAKGLSVKQGDMIPYIICLREDGTSVGKAVAESAQHPDDVKRAGSTLKIDYDAYLSNQILAPVERLCANVEGTDRPRLGACLGLDPSRTQMKGVAKDAEDKSLNPLQSQISDAERFVECKPFTLRCRHCQAETVYTGLVDNTATLVTLNGLVCSNEACFESITTGSAVVQLEGQIRGYISKFYESWLVCDDQACESRTRMMSVYGKRCLSTASPICRGQMHLEYSDRALYNQLLYLESIFDGERSKLKSAASPHADAVASLADKNKASLAQLKAVVTKHLDKNGRRWVGMQSLFSFMSRRR